jgi:hypothetical protein
MGAVGRHRRILRKDSMVGSAVFKRQEGCRVLDTSKERKRPN